MNSQLKIDTRVRSLKTYLQEFENGVFQIPSFQRDFLWSQDDIKELFDSIKNNYPIGSILFWKPFENSNVWVEYNTSIGPYKIKNINSKEPIYILDGFQRLSSLFGCLTNPKKFNNDVNIIDDKKWSEKFNLYYDLDIEEFTYLRQKSKNLPHQVPIYIFMNSIDFRQYARKEFEKIEDESKIEIYYDRADALGQIFNNYQIASVDITDATIAEAVEIFKRVNEKGMPISKDWIVSALTNRDNFRLGSEIDILINDLVEFNFHNIKRDIIFQCIQNSFGKIYFDVNIEDLVKRNDFVDVTKNAIESVKRAVRFLYENLLVLNNQLLPYNNQLIFLTTFFQKFSNDQLTEKQIVNLKKWFWLTTYSNFFTVNSLSNQRRAFEKFKMFIFDENIDPYEDDNIPRHFTLTQDFPYRLFLGSVRSKALVLFLINYSEGIKSINTFKIDTNNIENFEMGNLFEIPQKENPAENFVPILNHLRHMNIVANFTLFNLLNSKRQKNYSFLLRESNENYFINSKMVEMYNNNNSIAQILDERKYLIVEAEKSFVEELGFTYAEPLPF